MADTPTRQPLTGSCHCGSIRYVVFLTLPHTQDPANPPKRGDQRFFRCNCTTCHKMGIFDVRVRDNTEDFFVISPPDPLKDLGDYLTGNKLIHYPFCQTCGVRCFSFIGTGETVDVDLAELGVPGFDGPGTKTRVWRAARDGGHPEFGTYLAINGSTIDNSQRAFDMRELTEKKHVMYTDFLPEEDKQAPIRTDRPHDGGSY